MQTTEDKKYFKKLFLLKKIHITNLFKAYRTFFFLGINWAYDQTAINTITSAVAYKMKPK